MTQDRDLLPDAVLRYAEFDEGLIDLHLPATPNGTLVLLIHGGFWMEEWDRTHTRSQARDLAARGLLVATPEYRRVGGNGGWPATAYDVEAALSALPELLAGLGLTFARTALVGHSAGGHLALWLMSRPVAARVERVVALAPVVDLVRAQELDLDDGAVTRFLDGAPIADADPMTLLDLAPSAEVVLVHGDADELVPIELSRRFVQTHPWARLIELGGTGHFEFLDPRSAAWDRVVELLSPA